MNNKYFLYISDQFFESVKDSQVTNWLEVLGNHGVVFDLAITNPIAYILRHNKLRKEKAAEIRSKIRGKVFHIITFRNKDKTGISNFILFLFLLYRSLLARYRGKEVIIQMRGSKRYASLRMLKKFIPGIKIIFELRGAPPEEFVNIKNYQTIKEVTDEEIIREYDRLEKDVLRMINFSWKTLCVSQKLKQNLLGKTADIPESKIVVIPGAADESKFYFDEVQRARKRQELNLDGKKVFIYTGKLDSHWHMKEFIFGLMGRLMTENPEVFFICITPELTTARQMADKYGVDLQRCLLRHAKFDEINGYLSAADVALLIRADIATNNLASPTKLPEYLLSGLPVIISKGVGDYSDFVAANKLGWVVENDFDQLAARYRSEIKTFVHDRKKVAEITAKAYSKQVFIDTLTDVYKHI